MKLLLPLLILALNAVMAQGPAEKANLLKLTDEVQNAIRAGDWKKAAELSSVLKQSVRDARNQSMASTSSELADSILNWLPSDAETVVVAQEPVTLVEQDTTKAPSALAMAQGYVLGLLAVAENQKLENALLGRTVRLAALSARAFHNQSPDERNALPFGMIAYQGCAVYAFTETVPESMFSREPDESFIGHPVWISKGSQNDRPLTDTYLVAQPKADLILVCNDRHFFIEMMSRIASPKGPRALSASLPEWKQVDRTAPLWAVRHYRANPENPDPSGAASLLGHGKDPGAIGLTVEFGLTSGSVKARMISKSDPWKEIAGSVEFHGAAKSREVTEGVWELSVTGKPEAAGMAVFALMAILGFAVLI